MDSVITIGKIVAPHGVRGDIRILPMTENPDLFMTLDYLLLEDGSILHVERSRFQKNMVLVTTREINDMNGAEKLRNRSVQIKTEDLPPLPRGRYYVRDLQGFECWDENGNVIGTFRDTLQAGGADVFVIVTAEGKEIMVPAVADYILNIDTAMHKMLVRLPVWSEE